MKHCINCGKEINDDVVYCPYCGVVADASKSPPRQQPKQTNMMAVAGIICAFLVPIAGLICSILAKNKADSDYGGEGKSLAKAGIIVSICMMVLTIVLYFVAFNFYFDYFMDIFAKAITGSLSTSSISRMCAAAL